MRPADVVGSKQERREDTVRLTDIAARLPGLFVDAPVIARGALTAFLTRGSAKTSSNRWYP